MKCKRHYSLAEIRKIIAKETFSITPADAETIAKIFNYLTFAELKRIAKVIKTLVKGD